MSNGHGTVREVVWQDVCPWLIIVRTFRVAITFRVLILSAVAIVGVTAGWRLIGYAFYGPVPPPGAEKSPLQRLIDVQSIWPWQELPPTSSLEPPVVLDRILPSPALAAWFERGPIMAVWQALSAPFRDLFDQGISVEILAYLILCCLWAVLIWALFGGAITRIAALSLAREEQLGLFSALGYARAKVGSYFLAPLLPLVGVLLIMIPLVLLGLLMRIPGGVGILVGGIFWPLALLAGLLMAVMLIGLWFGWPLMWPTISTEGTDAFDALSRSYAYVYQRPLHYLFYTLVAALVGVLGVVVVSLFAFALVYLSSLAVSWGAGDDVLATLQPAVDEPEANLLVQVGLSLLYFWLACVRTIALGFQFGFFWTAATAIYLLLRRSVDATEMDEVHVEAQEETYGLPPLATDEKGVAGVADPS